MGCKEMVEPYAHRFIQSSRVLLRKRENVASRPHLGHVFFGQNGQCVVRSGLACASADDRALQYNGSTMVQSMDVVWGCDTHRSVVPVPSLAFSIADLVS
jgi:hypothetical protein